MSTAFLLPPQPIPPPIFTTTTTTPIFHRPAISITKPIIHTHHRRRSNQRSKIPKSSSSPSFRNGSTPPETDCPVPLDQQPVNEYQALSSSSFFSWASGDLVEYASRLFVTGASFALFVGLPVAWFGSIGHQSEPLNPVLAAVTSGLFMATLAVVRMYLGWAYVGNRLLSATVEYEETGWYDGQVWVKTPKVLARDRLLGSYTVKPVLNRLKNTLLGLAVSLLACVTLLIDLQDSQKNSYLSSTEAAGGRAVSGVYNDESARSFEPEAFCGSGDSELQ